MVTSQSHGFLYQDAARLLLGWKNTQQNAKDSYDLPIETAPEQWIFSFPKCNGHIKTTMNGYLAMSDAKKYITQTEHYYILVGYINQLDKNYKNIYKQKLLYISLETHIKICGDNTLERAIELDNLIKSFPKGTVKECRLARDEWKLKHPSNSLFCLDAKISDSGKSIQRRVQANSLNINKLENIISSEHIINIDDKHPLSALGKITAWCRSSKRIYRN